jgi:hypothetical protein
MAVTLVIRRARNQMDATWPHAECVTPPGPSRELRRIRRRIELGLVMRSTARDNVWVARIVTTTRPDYLNGGR